MQIVFPWDEILGKGSERSPQSEANDRRIGKADFNIRTPKGETAYLSLVAHSGYVQMQFCNYYNTDDFFKEVAFRYEFEEGPYRNDEDRIVNLVRGIKAIPRVEHKAIKDKWRRFSGRG